MKFVILIVFVLLAWWFLYKIYSNMQDYQKLAALPLRTRLWKQLLYAGSALLIAIFFVAMMTLGLAKELASLRYLFG